VQGAAWARTCPVPVPSQAKQVSSPFSRPVPPQRRQVTTGELTEILPLVPQTGQRPPNLGSTPLPWQKPQATTLTKRGVRQPWATGLIDELSLGIAVSLSNRDVFLAILVYFLSCVSNGVAFGGGVAPGRPTANTQIEFGPHPTNSNGNVKAAIATQFTAIRFISIRFIVDILSFACATMLRDEWQRTNSAKRY